MKDFLFVFRSGTLPQGPEEMQARMKLWMDWFGSIAAQNKLVDRGARLVPTTGKVVKSDAVVTDGPFVEIKESIGGYSIVSAETLEEATKLANGCPLFSYGGTVEVREIMKL